MSQQGSSLCTVLHCNPGGSASGLHQLSLGELHREISTSLQALHKSAEAVVSNGIGWQRLWNANLAVAGLNRLVSCPGCIGDLKSIHEIVKGIIDQWCTGHRLGITEKLLAVLTDFCALPPAGQRMHVRKMQFTHDSISSHSRPTCFTIL